MACDKRAAKRVLMRGDHGVPCSKARGGRAERASVERLDWSTVLTARARRAAPDTGGSAHAQTVRHLSDS